MALDGGGPTRAYNHRYKGNQSALFGASSITNLPIYLNHKQTSCGECTKVMHRALERGEDPLQFVGKHSGRCYRNSNLGPAVSEEYCAEEAGYELLYNSDGEYHGDEEAIYCHRTVGDGDTKGAKKLMRKQADIVGEPAEGDAEHDPDCSHFGKRINNALFSLRKGDKTFNGAGLLENSRIRVITSDIRRCCEWYHPFLVDLPRPTDDVLDSKREECLARIQAVIPHHCGDHSGCYENMCGYTDLKKEHPEWSDEQVAEEYAMNSRFHGKYMSLSNAGVKELQRIIQSNVDISNIDRVALLMSSNCIENLYSLCAMHTEGKRINLDQTDQWEMVLWTVICQISNEHFTEAVARRMGIESLENETQRVGRERILRQKRADRSRLSSEKSKARRRNQKRIRDARTGKESAKDAHRTDKMSPKEGGRQKRTRRVSTVMCGACGKRGHKVSDGCPFPRKKARSTGRGKQCKPVLVDWS